MRTAQYCTAESQPLPAVLSRRRTVNRAKHRRPTRTTRHSRQRACTATDRGAHGDDGQLGCQPSETTRDMKAGDGDTTGVPHERRSPKTTDDSTTDLGATIYTNWWGCQLATVSRPLVWTSPVLLPWRPPAGSRRHTAQHSTLLHDMPDRLSVQYQQTDCPPLLRRLTVNPAGLLRLLPPTTDEGHPHQGQHSTDCHPRRNVGLSLLVQPAQLSDDCDA